MLFMKAEECIKILLVKEKMTITALAEKISDYLGKKLSRSGLSNKLKNDTLRFNELNAICEILNYDLNFTKKQ